MTEEEIARRHAEERENMQWFPRWFRRTGLPVLIWGAWIYFGLGREPFLNAAMLLGGLWVITLFVREAQK